MSRLDLSRIDDELEPIDVYAEEVSLVKMPKCSDCTKPAGFRTDHVGSGPCFQHDANYRVAGLYSGSGAFTDALKAMDAAASPLDQIDTQIKVKQASLQVMMDQANACSAPATEDNPEGGQIPIKLNLAIAKLSSDISKDIERREKLEISRKNKLEVKQQFAQEVINNVIAIIRHRVEDKDTLKKIGEDLNKMLGGITKRKSLK